MPGRMGGKQVTVKNIWVYKIDPARNLIWVKGQVSGYISPFRKWVLGFLLNQFVAFLFFGAHNLVEIQYHLF